MVRPWHCPCATCCNVVFRSQLQILEIVLAIERVYSAFLILLAFSMHFLKHFFSSCVIVGRFQGISLIKTCYWKISSLVLPPLRFFILTESLPLGLITHIHVRQPFFRIRFFRSDISGSDRLGCIQWASHSLIFWHFVNERYDARGKYH